MPPSPDVAAITASALAVGDPDAWELLRASYRPLCIAWAARYDLDADDLWQEAAIRLWRALVAEKLASGPALGRWLQLSIRSAALDAVRSAALRPTCQLVDEPATTVAHPAELADFWVLALDALDDTAPLVLRRYVGGEAPADLMAETGMTPSEIYNVLRNGLGRLRRCKSQLLHAYTGEAA
jgi:DNA-directed RNA polymerase specialized sigma24 family protein